MSITNLTRSVVHSMFLILLVMSNTRAAAPDDVEFTVKPTPARTNILASFATEKDQGPAALLDDNEETYINAKPNTSGSVVSLYLRFPQALTDLVGVHIGAADPHHNYFPKEIHFHVDTNNDGNYETYVGMTTALGPAKQNIGNHLFAITPRKAYGLELRVVKMNRIGRQRAFMMNDLKLLHSDQTWTSDLNKPDTAEAPKPLMIDPSRVETPLMLLDMNTKPNGYVVNGAKKGQTGFYTSDEKAGGQVLALGWKHPKADRYLEYVLRGDDMPIVYVFDKGIVLNIPVNADNAPGTDTVGIRLLDAHGETFHWIAKFDPGKKGWQDVKVLLDVTQTINHYGGLCEHAHVVDEPVRIVSLMASAPEPDQFTENGNANVKYGSITRNAFSAEDITPLTLFNQIKVELHGPRKPGVLSTDELDEWQMSLRNNSDFKVNTHVWATMKAYDGTAIEWPGQTVTLEPKQSVALPFKPDLGPLGWYKADIYLRDPNSKVKHKALDTMFAVIEAAGSRPLSPADFQFGLGGALNNETTAELASLIGADWTRNGATWTEVEPKQGEWRFDRIDTTIELAKKHGIAIQLLTGYCPDWAALPDARKRLPKRRSWDGGMAPRLDAWRDYVRKLATRFSDTVHLWEIWNEPDLDGFYSGTTDHYLDMLRIAHEEFKAANPKHQVMTGGFATVLPHGGHNLNPNIHRRTLAEAQDFFDIHTHHQHGDFPGFSRAIDGPLAEMRQVLKSDKPLYLNETAYAAERGLEFQTETLVKKIAFSKARDVKAYSWFHIWRSRDPEGFGMLVDKTMDPRPILPAYNNLVRLLRDTHTTYASAPGSIDWALAYRKHNDERSILVVWSERRDSSGIMFFRVPQGADISIMDMMGNSRPMQTLRDVVAINLSRAPVYLIADSAAGPIEPLGTPIEMTDRIIGAPGEVRDLPIKLSNPFKEPTTIKLSWQSPGNPQQQRTIELAGAESREQTLPITLPDRQQFSDPITVQYELVGTPWSGKSAVPMLLTLTADGPLNADRTADFALDQRDDVVNFNENDPAREHMTWKGPDDLSANIWLGVDNDALQIQVDVRDDKHVQPYDGDRVWQADSIQMGIQTPGQQGFWEIGLSRHDSGKDQVHVWTGKGKLEQAAGRINLKTQPFEGGLRYRISIPIDLLGDRPGIIKQGLRFNLIVNDRDTDSRDGFVQITPGIGSGGKSAEQFPVILLK